MASKNGTATAPAPSGASNDKVAQLREKLSATFDSARETAGQIGGRMQDFFSTNPLNTPVGAKIEVATDANVLSAENWGLNMEICDMINATESGPQDAAKAIMKRLHTQIAKNNSIVMFTLTLLEACVKNCNARFHSYVCQKDYVLELVKLIGKFDAPQPIQERVLSLIQTLSLTFGDNPELHGVREVYDDLRAKGVEFPSPTATGIGGAVPIITPKRSVPLPQQQPQQVQQPAVLQEDELQGGGFYATPEQLVKLRNEIDICHNNIRVFRSLLNEPQTGADELSLLDELNSTCRQMQRRVVDLLTFIGNEEVTYELLVINDEFNAVFEKYDRFRTSADETSAQGSSSSQSAAAIPQPPPPAADPALIDFSLDNTPAAAPVSTTATEPTTSPVQPRPSTPQLTAAEAAETERWLREQDGAKGH